MLEKVLVSVAVDSFLEAVAGSVAPSTLKLYRHYLTRFADAHAGMTLDEVTPAVVARWNPRYHPAGCVRRLLRWSLVEARLIDVNPLDGIRLKRNGSRQRIASIVERVRLLRRADRTFRRLLVALIETGARSRELRSVRLCDIHVSGSPAWTDEDLVAGRCFFRLVRFKGQELRRDRLAVRNIPISRRLGRLIVRVRGRLQPGQSHLFLNRLGKPWTCNAVRCRFRRLRVAAGVQIDADGENVVCYTMRHTAITDAVGAGVEGMTLAELYGHSDVRMTQRYVHLRPDHLLKAQNRVSEWKQGRNPKKDRTGLRRNASDA